MRLYIQVKGWRCKKTNIILIYYEATILLVIHVQYFLEILESNDLQMKKAKMDKDKSASLTGAFRIPVACYVH